MKKYDCHTCDNKVTHKGDYCRTCKRFWAMMKKRAQRVEARKKRKARK